MIRSEAPSATFRWLWTLTLCIPETVSRVTLTYFSFNGNAVTTLCFGPHQGGSRRGRLSISEPTHFPFSLPTLLRPLIRGA